VLPDRVQPDDTQTVIERETLVCALRQLSPRQRAVVVLRYFDDLTERETAHIIGCSIGSVKRHTSRAFERLRHLLGTDLGAVDELTTPVLAIRGVSC
jgi:RNA polymerase sigma factor (sigma-70 family)